MNEKERNRRFFLLMAKLLSERDEDSIELLETMVLKDTPSIQKTFKIMKEKIFIHNDCSSSAS